MLAVLSGKAVYNYFLNLDRTKETNANSCLGDSTVDSFYFFAIFCVF